MNREILHSLITQHLEPYLSEFKFKLFGFNLSGFGICYENKNIFLANGFQQFQGGNWDSFTPTGKIVGFKQVENLLIPLLTKYQLWQLSGLNEPPQELITFWEINVVEGEGEYIKEFSNFRISNEEDIMHFCEMAKFYFEKFTFPWFQKYSQLEAVNAYVNSMDDFASGESFSPPHMFRKMIIKKICKDPGYESYADYWVNRIDSLKDIEDGKYYAYYPACLELKEILSKL